MNLTAVPVLVLLFSGLSASAAYAEGRWVLFREDFSSLDKRCSSDGGRP